MFVNVRDLRVSFRTYGGSVFAVRGVNLGIEAGECVAIVGESGCGKSVTAQTMMRLIPSPPAEISGSIEMDGTDLLALPERKMKEIRGKAIGMIFQDPMTSLDPTMQIGRQIMEGIRVHDRRMKRAEAFERAVEALGLVGMPEPRAQFRRYAYEFSGGMRQRVMIAMAVICKPRLLLADEPTTALDVTTQAQILGLIRDLKTRLGSSVVLITHDMGVVANMADRIAVFYAGQVVEEGGAPSVFRNPAHPYTAALLMSRPRLDLDRNQKLLSIPGAPPDLFAPPGGCGFFERCPVAMEICADNPPEFMDCGEPGHKSLCWLHHEYGEARRKKWLAARAGL
ncbi:MAG: ABC transporter ATP-binding protein [Synergistaceae bacterium]|jgi:oligopeptide transport system ATP-binding protein|nr:ABC transporter ATP-binding protein [Synergistaceae bacterium]